MSATEMNMDQLKKLKQNPNQEVVVMLNLLKFKPNGGLESYKQYIQAASPFVEAVGGKTIYLGKPDELLNGDETWDLMMLVQYPSRAAFLDMANDPEYIKIHAYREEAVEKAMLYAIDRIGYRCLLDMQED